jgi:hypothetical protein
VKVESNFMASSNLSVPKSPSTSTKPPRELTMDERGEQLVQQALRNLRRAAQQKQEKAARNHK